MPGPDTSNLEASGPGTVTSLKTYLEVWRDQRRAYYSCCRIRQL